ncbi:carbon-nitrogen hydrolase family protein [Phytoactinopolyspora alkaliphila]|uniref:Carbon-nitrogen hydrolase family protein n=1 Tax=Phytoactinopolyspora alkaliphila TaxID=1783498 RepID=A0A6N9YGX8_9ACTN|nr:carbon-nitrogen hydrolase family protein [Phytoactinopolyspora alkaliphila]NED94187.1 carbon-nitrogen hydrolase family protein [Phytoactinopolyspora alkaliphila]
MRIGACQTAEILGDIEPALACIEDFATEADVRGVDLLLFPECFLQGYLVEEQHVHEHAVDLGSPRFGSVLRRMERFKPTLVFGVIEQDGQTYFNTAVVVTRGRLMGVYRKTHLVPGESLFHKGDAYPTFEMQGIRFGINICYDTQFAEAAAPIAAQGAQLLLVPAQNMMRRDAAHHWKHLHNTIRTERAREAGMWLVSADVTGERDECRIGLGPTSIINPRGEVVAEVPLMTTGMAVADIS